MAMRRFISSALLAGVLCGCIQSFGQSPDHSVQGADPASITKAQPSPEGFQSLFKKGEALLSALSSECTTAQDGALLKAMRYELSELQTRVNGLSEGWTFGQIQAALKDPSEARNRAKILAAYRMATLIPQWQTRIDPRGNQIFFQGSAALVDSEWALGVRIRAEDVDKRNLLRTIRDFCVETEALRSPFSQAFQELGKEAADQASARSDAFIANTFNRQFPWESWLNGYWASGTLTQPPQHQFILGHLHGGLVLATRGKVTASPSVLLEVFGWEHLTPKYETRWGVSAAYAPRLRPEERDGGGVLFRIRSQSFGVVWKADAGQARTPHLVYSVALGKWLAGSR